LFTFMLYSEPAYRSCHVIPSITILYLYKKNYTKNEKWFIIEKVNLYLRRLYIWMVVYKEKSR
jgi:hypothetical protein